MKVMEVMCGLGKGGKVGVLGGGGVGKRVKMMEVIGKMGMEEWG